jgi:hypothetical protein
MEGSRLVAAVGVLAFMWGDEASPGEWMYGLYGLAGLVGTLVALRWPLVGGATIIAWTLALPILNPYILAAPNVGLLSIVSLLAGGLFIAVGLRTRYAPHAP